MRHGMTWAAVVVGAAVGLVGVAACDLIGLGGSGGYGGSCEGSGGYGGSGAVCEIVSQGPCYERCETEYNNAAAACGSIANDADRKACQDAAYATYKECRSACAGISSPECDDKYQACRDYGPSSCGAVSGGKTVCYRCWERCNAGDSPSSTCKKCKF